MQPEALTCFWYEVTFDIYERQCSRIKRVVISFSSQKPATKITV